MRIRHLAGPALALALLTAIAPSAGATTTHGGTASSGFGTVTSYDADTGALVVATASGGSLSASVTDRTLLRLATGAAQARGRHGDDASSGSATPTCTPSTGSSDTSSAGSSDTSSASSSGDSATRVAAHVTGLKALRAKQVKAGRARAAKITSLRIRAARVRLAKLRAAAGDSAGTSCPTRAQRRAQRRTTALAALVAGATVQRLALDPRSSVLREVVVAAAS